MTIAQRLNHPRADVRRLARIQAATTAQLRMDVAERGSKQNRKFERHQQFLATGEVRA